MNEIGVTVLQFKAIKKKENWNRDNNNTIVLSHSTHINMKLAYNNSRDKVVIDMTVPVDMFGRAIDIERQLLERSARMQTEQSAELDHESHTFETETSDRGNVSASALSHALILPEEALQDTAVYVYNLTRNARAQQTGRLLEKQRKRVILPRNSRTSAENVSHSRGKESLHQARLSQIQAGQQGRNSMTRAQQLERIIHKERMDELIQDSSTDIVLMYGEKYIRYHRTDKPEDWETKFLMTQRKSEMDLGISIPDPREMREKVHRKLQHYIDKSSSIRRNAEHGEKEISRRTHPSSQIPYKAQIADSTIYLPAEDERNGVPLSTAPLSQSKEKRRGDSLLPGSIQRRASFNIGRTGAQNNQGELSVNGVMRPKTTMGLRNRDIIPDTDEWRPKRNANIRMSAKYGNQSWKTRSTASTPVPGENRDHVDESTDIHTSSSTYHITSVPIDLTERMDCVHSEFNPFESRSYSSVSTFLTEVTLDQMPTYRHHSQPLEKEKAKLDCRNISRMSEARSERCTTDSWFRHKPEFNSTDDEHNTPALNDLISKYTDDIHSLEERFSQYDNIESNLNAKKKLRETVRKNGNDRSGAMNFPNEEIQQSIKRITKAKRGESFLVAMNDLPNLDELFPRVNLRRIRTHSRIGAQTPDDWMNSIHSQSFSKMGDLISGIKDRAFLKKRMEDIHKRIDEQIRSFTVNGDDILAWKQSHQHTLNRRGAEYKWLDSIVDEDLLKSQDQRDRDKELIVNRIRRNSAAPKMMTQAAKFKRKKSSRVWG